MAMRKLVAIIFILTLMGCHFSTQTPTTQQRTITNNEERLQWVGALSQGVGTTLDANNVQDAKTLNNQIGTIAEAPTQEQVATVVQSLTNADDKKKLQEALDSLVVEKRKIAEDSRVELQRLNDANAKLKQKAEDTQEELSKFNSPWYSIKHGFITLLKRFAWWGGGLAIAFILLRVFAASNPIIGAIYSVFSHIVAGIVKALAKVFPALLEHIGAVNADIHNAKNTVLEKIVDEIQSLKSDGTIEDLKQSLAKRLDATDKRIVDSIKQDFGWK